MIRVPIKTDGISHIRLTVTDIARSRAFYEAVFGWPVLLEVRPDANGATREQLGFRYSGVIYRAGSWLLGLRPVAEDTAPKA